MFPSHSNYVHTLAEKAITQSNYSIIRAANGHRHAIKLCLPDSFTSHHLSGFTDPTVCVCVCVSLCLSVRVCPCHTWWCPDVPWHDVIWRLWRHRHVTQRPSAVTRWPWPDTDPAPTRPTYLAALPATSDALCVETEIKPITTTRTTTTATALAATTNTTTTTTATATAAAFTFYNRLSFLMYSTPVRCLCMPVCALKLTAQVVYLAAGADAVCDWQWNSKTLVVWPHITVPPIVCAK